MVLYIGFTMILVCWMPEVFYVIENHEQGTLNYIEWLAITNWDNMVILCVRKKARVQALSGIVDDIYEPLHTKDVNTYLAL